MALSMFVPRPSSSNVGIESVLTVAIQTYPFKWVSKNSGLIVTGPSKTRAHMLIPTSFKSLYGMQGCNVHQGEFLGRLCWHDARLVRYSAWCYRCSAQPITSLCVRKCSGLEPVPVKPIVI